MYSVTYASHQKSCTTFSISKYLCKVFRKQDAPNQQKLQISKTVSNRSKGNLHLDLEIAGNSRFFYLTLVCTNNELKLLETCPSIHWAICVKPEMTYLGLYL